MNNIWKNKNYSKDFYEEYKNDYCFEYITINKLDSNFLLYSINKHIIEDNMCDIRLESIEVNDCSKEYGNKSFQAICAIGNNTLLKTTSFIIKFNVDCGYNLYDVRIVEKNCVDKYDELQFEGNINYTLDVFKEHINEMLQTKQRYCYNVIKEYKNVLNFHYM